MWYESGCKLMSRINLTFSRIIKMPNIKSTEDKSFSYDKKIKTDLKNQMNLSVMDSQLISLSGVLTFFLMIHQIGGELHQKKMSFTKIHQTHKSHVVKICIIKLTGSYYYRRLLWLVPLKWNIKELLLSAGMFNVHILQSGRRKKVHTGSGVWHTRDCKN